MTRCAKTCSLLLTWALAACGANDSHGAAAGSGGGGAGGRAAAQGGKSGASGRAAPGDLSNLPSAAHTLAGVVTDVGTGSRVGSAAVSVEGGDRKVMTNDKGEFALPDLPEGPVNLSISKDGYAPGFAAAESSGRAEANLVSLKRLGKAQSYDPSKPATLSEKTDNGPYAVIFTPDSLDTSDTQLKVMVTPLDPTHEDAALPGDLIAGGSTPNPLEAVTFAEFSIVDSSGKRVNLKADASAIVELPIPLGLREDYPLGSKIHCYAYDPATGKWEDFVEGTVATSTVDKVTPVLRASIRHFSWYGGAPTIQDQECVVVQVFSKVTGKPLEGATITARPGLKAVSNQDGVASVTVKKGVKVKYTATKTYTDTYVDDKGNLIPQQGSKVIEFGRVEQDDELVSLVPGPCKASSSAPDASKPVRVETGPLPSGAFVYQVTAVVSSGSTSVIVEKGVPDENGDIDEPEPVDDASVKLQVDGGSEITLASLSSMLPAGTPAMPTGLYTSPSGAMVSAKGGERYTLSVDVDGNGSVDATASCAVPGTLSWVVPASGAEYAADGFTASWNDSASSTPNYSAQYIAVFVGQNGNSLGAVYTGSERTFTPDPALKPDSYRATLQTNYSQTMFTGVSVQGSLLCGGATDVPVNFTIK